MLPSPGMVLDAIVYGMLIPAAVAFVGLLLALRWARRQWLQRGAEALALGAGLLAGLAALAASDQLGWEFLKPDSSWTWLPGLAVLAVAAEALGPVWLRWAVRLVVAGLTAWLLVGAERSVQPVSPVWYAGLALAVLALWGVVETLAIRMPGPGLPVLLAVVALAAAVVLECADILKFAQMAGVLLALLGAGAVVAWLHPGRPVLRGAAPILAVMLPGLLFAGFFATFSSVPLASFLLVLAAPLVLGLTTCRLPGLLPRSRQRGVQIGVVLLLLVIAVTLAALA